MPTIESEAETVTRLRDELQAARIQIGVLERMNAELRKRLAGAPEAAGNTPAPTYGESMRAGVGRP